MFPPHPPPEVLNCCEGLGWLKSLAAPFVEDRASARAAARAMKTWHMPHPIHQYCSTIEEAGGMHEPEDHRHDGDGQDEEANNLRPAREGTRTTACEVRALQERWAWALTANALRMGAHMCLCQNVRL